LYEHREEFERLIPNYGLQYLVLYMLDHLDLTEHGGTVGGGWLTDKGKSVLDALQREAATEFTFMHCNHCIHGYDVEAEILDCPECGPLNHRPLTR
jgi:hypothetical protein